MTIYVDVLFLLNTVVNFLLLRGSAWMGGLPAPLWRLAAGAVLGGLYAVAAVVPGLSWLQTGVFQALSALAMLVLAFGWRRSTVKQGLFFFALSFSFSGVVLLAVQLLEPDCRFLGGRAYYAVTTPALLLLAGLCYGLSALVLAGWGTHLGGDLVPVTLSLGDRKTKLCALRDTGNTLRDPVTGRSVLVADWRVLARLLPEARLSDEAVRDGPGLVQRLSAAYPGLRFRLIPYRAVGLSGGLLPAVRCRLREQGTWQEGLVAFAAQGVAGQGRFEGLLGGAVL